MVNFNKYDEVLKKARILAITKNKAYGDDNLKRYGIRGLIMRINEKIDRINYMADNTDKDLMFETMNDTTLDLLNYSVYLYLMMDGELFEK